MKSLLLVLLFSFITANSFAYNPKLDPAIKSVQDCLASEGVFLCDPAVNVLLENVDLNVRGEFALFLKEMINSNQTAKIVTNLYKELQVLVPMYERLDTCSQWSCSNLKQLQDTVSVLFVKYSEIDSDLLVKLYKSQSGEVGRYNLLLTLNDKISSLTSVVEMEKLVSFLEIAKEHSRVVRDESYLYRTCVDLIRQLTVKLVNLRPGHEGIYSLSFDDKDLARDLRIDRVVIMESNNRDSLVVNFVASKSNMVNISFEGAGILGNTIYSNQDVYNNDQNTANPFFKLELNRETNTIKGLYSTARYGVLAFTGKLLASNLSVFSNVTVKGLGINQLIGTHSVKVGSSVMKLIIKKRTDERSIVEAALFNDNAMISFSKVTLNSEKGILSIVDYNNERKLTLAITSIENGVVLSGQFLNSPQSKIFEVNSL